jgi:NAD(P)-dependent dehydrogenase (short-subunit alcohol dehydrogenase family)
MRRLRKLDLSMQGKAGIVTGATGGIGGAIASSLGESGARVMLTGRSDDLKPIAVDLDAEFCAADLASDGAADDVVAQTLETFGKLDFVVNVAGVQSRGAVVDFLDEEWEKLYAVNLRAVFRMSRAAARQMLEQDTGGSILNISSTSATVGVPGIVPYGTLKGGVTSFTRGLAIELAPHGVRVNAIAPGYVRTAMTGALLEDEQQLARVHSRIPLGRVADPEEIASAAVFLLSPAASYITGEVLNVDGGQVAQ